LTSQPASPVRTYTILVVDDDPLVLMGTVDMLADLGHVVLEAPSAQAALEIVRSRNDIELVLSDQAMPFMSGAQLALTLRSEFPTLPIVLATGYAELPPELPRNIPRLGKPFSQAELAQIVQDSAGGVAL
jgi:CheY-like chemotaxis protein